jgi:aryl-alcohol dehydrogenase-like predicted oxidoreductase
VSCYASDRLARYRTLTAPSKLALGAGRLGAFWQGNSLRESVRTLEAALEGGIRVIDTADVYALGLSERVVGRVLRGRRADTLVCTKLGQLKTPLATLVAHQRAGTLSLASLSAAIPRKTPADAALVPRSFDSAYLRWAMERSLARLGSEQVDIVLLHSPTVDDVRARRFEPAAQHFLSSGQAANFGISCDNVAVARAAAELPYVSFVELPFDIASPSQRGALSELAAQGIGVLARSPFAGGQLIAKLRAAFGRFDDELAACCVQAVSELPEVFSTIIGMSSAARVRENLRLLALPVSPQRRAEVEQLFASGKAAS